MLRWQFPGIIVLSFDIPLPGQHVLLGSVTASHLSLLLLSATAILQQRGRLAATVHRGMRTQEHILATVGENWPEAGRRKTLINRDRLSMVLQHGRVQEPVTRLFPGTTLRQAAVS